MCLLDSAAIAEGFMMAQGEDERRQQGVEDGWICVGAFTGAHGVKGDVRLRSFTADPADLFTYKDVRLGADGPAVKLKKIREVKDGFIGRASNVRYRDEAEAVKGKRLYVARDEFDDTDEDEFYLADLIGLRAEDTAGKEIGFIKSVENFGAEDLLEVVLNEPVKGLGRHGFVPFRTVLVPVVDLDGGFVQIALGDWLESQVGGKVKEQGEAAEIEASDD